MEILETIDVYLEKEGIPPLSTVPFYMMDEGKRFFVNIPKDEAVLDAFHWMASSNILGDLVSVQPVVISNSDEIQDIMDTNLRTFEIATTAGAVSLAPPNFAHGYLPGSHQDKYTYATWPGKRVVPTQSWKAVWTFWKPESAVLFKLGVPGVKCDTMK